MFEILIELPGKPQTVGRLVKGVYRIGSSPAAHIQIDRAEISARHAILTVTDDDVTLADAGSRNGTFLDGKKVSNPLVLAPGQVVQVGEAKIGIRVQGAADAPAPAAKSADADSAEPVAAKEDAYSEKGVSLLRISGIGYEYRKVAQTIKHEVHEELLNRLNLKNLTVAGASGDEIREQARLTIRKILGDRAANIPRGVPVDVLEVELLNEAVALGPLEHLLVNEDVTEIMVNGASNVFVEKSGNLYRTDLSFADDAQVLKVMERIVAPIGRRIDESQPLVDARLPDGSRVNCIIPPLAIDGPTLTIRKFSKKPVTVDNLVAWGSTTHDIVQFLRAAVIVRKNILVSGGTGSGKTTLLNVLSGFIPNSERIVTIEDAAELRLGQDHLVRLEARPPNIEGKGEIAIRELVRNSLRMRPDRIVVGECRSGEALDMLQAMNTGHDGSLTTVHANSPRDALSRLETLVLMAGFDLPLRAIREQIAAAISLIVQVSRMSDGTRKMLKVSEVTGMEGDIITTQDIFEYVVEGTDGEGAVNGYHDACGMVPTFARAMALAGLQCDLGIFEKRN
jgi:pilus assembly protein CpaF